LYFFPLPHGQGELLFKALIWDFRIVVNLMQLRVKVLHTFPGMVLAYLTNIPINLQVVLYARYEGVGRTREGWRSAGR